MARFIITKNKVNFLVSNFGKKELVIFESFTHSEKKLYSRFIDKRKYRGQEVLSPSAYVKLKKDKLEKRQEKLKRNNINGFITKPLKEYVINNFGEKEFMILSLLTTQERYAFTMTKYKNNKISPSDWLKRRKDIPQERINEIFSLLEKEINKQKDFNNSEGAVEDSKNSDLENSKFNVSDRVKDYHFRILDTPRLRELEKKVLAMWQRTEFINELKSNKERVVNG